jgi:hypothetical protein
LINTLTIVGVMSIIGSNTSDKERPTYIGLAGAMWGLASVLGPVLGGTLSHPYPLCCTDCRCLCSISGRLALVFLHQPPNRRSHRPSNDILPPKSQSLPKPNRPPPSQKPRLARNIPRHIQSRIIHSGPIVRRKPIPLVQWRRNRILRRRRRPMYSIRIKSTYPHATPNSRTSNLPHALLSQKGYGSIIRGNGSRDLRHVQRNILYPTLLPIHTGRHRY